MAAAQNGFAERVSASGAANQENSHQTRESNWPPPPVSTSSSFSSYADRVSTRVRPIFRSSAGVTSGVGYLPVNAPSLKWWIDLLPYLMALRRSSIVP